MSDEEFEQSGPRRPRVVDKRISARGDAPIKETAAPLSDDPAPADPVPAAAPDAPIEPPSGFEASPPASVESPVWTPEQEAEARRIAEEISRTPSIDWVVNTAVTLANVAATKIELGDPSDAGLAIDALAGLVNSLGAKLLDAEAPLRQTLAQLQMAYTERSMNVPGGASS